MEFTTSTDGTRIAYHRRGAGPPLVLVHGTGGANPALGWTDVVPELENHFTIYAMDRRGRGESGDTVAYAIEREFEDVAAIIKAAGAPANVLGHSYGALCALGAALLTPNIHRLILYEPALNLSASEPAQYERIPQFEALLAAGDREGLYTLFLREDVGMSANEIARLRASPTWPARLASVHTLPREFRAEEQFQFDPRQFHHLRFPTLLLLGSDSPTLFKQAVEAIHAALPHSRIDIMAGQEHVAMYSAPDLFLERVLHFLFE